MEIKILVVEDYLADLFIGVLSLYNGFEFVVVPQGAKAVELVREGHFDLVLMDIRLPVMNGVDAIRQIRKFNKTIPIIALTAWTDKSTRRRVKEAGANDFFRKPPDYARLYRRIIELLAEQPLEQAAGSRKEEIVAKHKRLYLLKQKQAVYGIDTPPQVILEIEDLERELGIS